MSRSILPAFCAAVLAAAGLESASAAEPSKRLDQVREIARTHAASPTGRQWLSRHRTTAGQRMIPVVNRCTPESPDEEVMAFSIYLRLSQKGRVLEVITDVDESLDRCMTAVARAQVTVPQAPREDFWVQLNLAAGM